MSVTAFRHPWLLASLAAIVLSAVPAAAWAQDSGSTPTEGTAKVSLDALDDAGKRQSTRLPWLSINDLEWHQHASVMWNTWYRAGTGQAVVMPIEMNRYDYNNKTDRVDSGVIKEISHTLTLAGSLFPYTRMFVSFGLVEAGIDLGDDNAARYAFYNGLQVSIGGDLAFPLPIMIDDVNVFTLIFRGYWRQWEGTNGNGTGSASLQAKSIEWHGQALVSWQILGGRGEFTWDLYVGGHWAYTTQRWEISSTSLEKITPDNSASQKNGSGRYSLIVGTTVYPWSWMSFTVESQFIGPFRINAMINLLF